ncbi:thermonuclease family protein [Sphingobacterium kitahiroshimense]|uniref:thermonuclease family protein n=1 Tax=Sphingobacterium kitahiroshimense TaxID=470446 RepID=UPI00320A0720
MKNYFFIILFILPLCLISQTIKGKVIRVADGDTITILDSDNNQLRVRLCGIDVPEKGQDFADVA